MSSPGNQVMYFVRDGPDRVSLKEELMTIPEDKELPLDCFKKW